MLKHNGEMEIFARAQLEGLEVPEEAMSVINEEMEKLSTLEKNSSEFNVTRSYLDWLTSVPWGKLSEENFDIERAQEILDEVGAFGSRMGGGTAVTAIPKAVSQPS